MSDLGEFQQLPYDVVAVEFDLTDRLVTISVVDPARASRDNGVLPEVRQIRLDGQKWETYVEEILVDVNDLLVAVDRSGSPMTRPSRGSNVPAE